MHTEKNKMHTECTSIYIDMYNCLCISECRKSMESSFISHTVLPNVATIGRYFTHWISGSGHGREPVPEKWASNILQSC